MTIAKNLLWGVTGAVGALAVVLSCGDDTTANDAAAQDAASNCDCPAAPQLIDERLRRIQASDMIESADTDGIVEVNCAGEFGVGAVVLSGGCRTGGSTGTLRLTRSVASNDNGWACEWYKEDGGVGNSYEIQAHAVCLVPEGTPLPDAGQ